METWLTQGSCDLYTDRRRSFSPMAQLHDLSSLSLFRATPAQVLESRKRTWPEWGGVLTEAQYMERDNQMDTMEHAANSQMITWVLAPRDNPETLDFACACETYRRTGFIRYNGSREVQAATCYGVACVYTPPHKRGKGYGSHMMRLVHWVTSGRTSEFNLPPFPAEWGSPPPVVEEAGNGMFSILYSAVGDNFYSEAGPGTEKFGGWEARGPISTTWEIPEQDGECQIDEDEGWRWLKYEDLDVFWAKDVQLIRRTMESLPESSPDYYAERPTAFVSYLPDKGVGSFHIYRSMFALDHVVSMDIWGVEKEDSANADQPTYAAWTVDTKPLPPVLVVTRMSATEEDFPKLIRKIQEVAAKSGIRKMEAWNIPRRLIRAVEETGGMTFERQTRLPAIKWYGKGETADVEWVFNEKFCWC